MTKQEKNHINIMKSDGEIPVSIGICACVSACVNEHV